MISRFGLYFAWVIVFVASIGSLYYSELAHLAPCSLCWYQRAMAFSLTIILGIAAYRRDIGVVPYAVGLAIVGLLIAFYQILEHYFPGLGLDLCGPGGNCSNNSVYYFGFLSIPMMSLVAFALTLFFLFRAKKPPVH